MFVKLYGFDGVHSHTLYLNMWDVHASVSDYSSSLDYNSEVSMRLLNKKICYNQDWVDVVYLLAGTDQITGYYLLLPDDFDLCYSLMLTLLKVI